MGTEFVLLEVVIMILYFTGICKNLFFFTEKKQFYDKRNVQVEKEDMILIK